MLTGDYKIPSLKYDSEVLSVFYCPQFASISKPVVFLEQFIEFILENGYSEMPPTVA